VRANGHYNDLWFGLIALFKKRQLCKTENVSQDLAASKDVAHTLAVL
jgi:hypothetical protein